MKTEVREVIVVPEQISWCALRKILGRSDILGTSLQPSGSFVKRFVSRNSSKENKNKYSNSTPKIDTEKTCAIICHRSPMKFTDGMYE
jgi:hypothetical protein